MEGSAHPDNKGRPGTKVLRLAIGLAVSVVFIGLALLSLSRSGVTVQDVLRRTAHGHYQWVALYAGILVLLQAARIWRWGLLVRGIAPVGWKPILAVGAVGQMAIALFPMRLGEAVRPWLIAEGRQIRFSQATATVVVERVVDGLVISAMFIGTLFFLRDLDLPPAFRVGAQATAILFGAAAAFLLVASLVRNRTERIIGRLVMPLAPRLGAYMIGAIDSFFDAVRTLLSQPKRGAAYLAITIVTWLVNGLSLVPIFWAFDQDLPLVASFAILCVIVVGFMIPSGPAAAGTFNYAIILALSAFMTDDALIGLLAILLHLVVIAVDVLIGLVGLWLGGFGLKRLFRATTAPAPATPNPEP